MGIDFKRPRHVRGFRFGEALVWDFTSRPLVEKTVFGAIATFADGADGAPLKKCEITLPASLDGYSQVEVVHTGSNVWDEVTEIGAINVVNGQNVANNNFIRSTNYIPVLPNTTYYKCAPQNYLQLYYDKDKGYLSYGSWNKNTTFTTPANCYFVRFYVAQEYGTTYNNDISLNYPSTFTEYAPYNGEAYNIDIPNPNPNLFDKTGGTYTSGRWKTDGTVESDWGVRAYKIAISEKTDYVIHGEAFCGFTQSQFVVFFDANDNFISYAPFTHTNYTAKVTSPANSAYIGVTWEGLFQTVNDSVKEDFSVYGGSIDVVNGQSESTHANVKVSDLTWIKQTASGRDFFIAQVSDMKTGTPKDIASVLPYGGEITVAAMADKSLASWTNSLRIYDTDITTVPELLEAYGNDGISYPLATAEPFNVEPIAIDSKAGTNNIWNDAGDTEVTYYAYAD